MRRPQRPSRSFVVLVVAGLALAGWASIAAAGPDPANPLPTVDSAAIAAALASMPAPRGLMPAQDLPVAANPEAAGDPAAVHSRPASPDGAAAADERIVVDTFEQADWPNTPPHVILGGTRWVPQTRTDLRRPADGYLWATSTCQKADGLRSLCPVCAGGAPGQPHACGATYPADTAPSILLLLDLTRQQNMDRLDLVMDIWPDAPADEGFMINYVAYDRSGELAERRTVFSATGRLRDWARGQRLNLLDLRDVRDPRWRGKLAGQWAYLEFLFLSGANSSKGAGIFVDNLALDVRAATVAVTPIPPPTPSSPSTARNCPAGAKCGTLQVEAYVDYQCNGRFQSGVDRRLGGLWVDVVAGAVSLRAILSPSGSAFFYMPIDGEVTVTTEFPPQHKMCANSANPLTLRPADFGRYGRKKVSFRMVEAR